jgi:tRNA (adenine22-N1)-methyltransferase
MDLSPRLKKIVDMIPTADVVADIGTDHGYVLIELLRQKKINTGIASDNKVGPLDKARMNAAEAGVKDDMRFSLGDGLETLKGFPVNGAVLAGMGGVLTRDLLEKDFSIVKKLDFLLLQPAQNPEVLREYLYNGPFTILDEALIREERRFYEAFLVCYCDHPEKMAEHVNYLVGERLIQNQDSLLPDFLEEKIREGEAILAKLELNSESAQIRQQMLTARIKDLRRLKDDCAG